MNKKAYANIRKEYETQWLTEESLTKWLGIRSILSRFKSGKLTNRQVSFWESRHE